MNSTQLTTLADWAQRLVTPGGRALLGLAGPPGAGKSTLAAELCARLGPSAARVPMDGFHLANVVLDQLGLTARKGSPASFDVGGFRALLVRLRANEEDVIYAPEFLREIDEAVAGALPVRKDVPLIIVEGNYLLLDDGDWAGIARLFDEIWYLCPDEALRRDRLIQRHRSYGRSTADAQAWVAGNDDLNARTIAATAARAHRIVRC